MFWSRKKPEATKLDMRPERPSIAFRKEDDARMRAANIWYSLGFVNDRLGSIDRIAGYLLMYAEMDRGEDPAERPGLYVLGPAPCEDHLPEHAADKADDKSCA